MAPYPSRLELGPAANDQRSPFRAERRVQTAGSWASRWSARACSSACLLERVQPPAGEPALAVGLGLGAHPPLGPSTQSWWSPIRVCRSLAARANL